MHSFRQRVLGSTLAIGLGLGLGLGLDVYGAGAASAPATSPMRFVMARAQMPNSYRASAASNTVCLTQLIVRTWTVAPQYFRFVFMNRANNNVYTSPAVYGEKIGLNDITIRAALELCQASPQIAHITFNGGSDTVTIPPGSIVMSDICTMTPGANKVYSVHTETTVATAGMSWPSPGAQASSTTAGTSRADQQFEGTPAQTLDQVYSTGQYTTTGMSSTAGNFPAAIVGQYADGYATGAAAPLVIGDSIFQSQNGGSFNWFPTTAGTNGVFIRKAMRFLQYHSCFASLGSTQALGWTGDITGQSYLMQFASHVITNLGTNDFGSGGATDLQVRSYITLMYNEAKRRNPNVIFWALPILPVTSSADLFVTTINQTYPTGRAPGASADLYNQWLPSASPILTYDYTGPARDVTEPLKWAVTGLPNAYTDPVDNPLGIHPNITMHGMLAVPLETGLAGWVLA